jgi:hypothetical protein
VGEKDFVGPGFMERWRLKVGVVLVTRVPTSFWNAKDVLRSWDQVQGDQMSL